MAKLFGCPINLEGDGGGSSIAVELSRTGNQPYGEATSFSAGLSPIDQREETVPYLRFLDSNSDSGSVSMESEIDLNHCFIDFFDRESHAASNQRLSSSYGFDIWGVQDMEVEIELGLRTGSRSGWDDLGEIELGLQVTGIDSGRVEVETGRVEIGSSRVEVETGRVGVDSGRVEVETGRVGVDSGRVEVETGRVGVDSGRVEVDTGRVEVDTGRVEVDVEAMAADEAQDAITWVSVLMGEEEPMDQESHVDFFDDFFDHFFYSPYEEFADNHGDYEDVLARSFDESGANGSPPASKRVVDELPDAEITSEELSIGCAICKDEIMVEEMVKKLPCRHYYHRECIVPWLGIRNTCPVCRYELPTDDLEYERNRRSQRRGGSGFDEIFDV